MDIERKSRRTILGAVGFGVAAAIIGPPLLHVKNTQRVLEAVLGSEVDCATGKEAKEHNYDFDAIVVPGAGSIWTAEGFTPNEYGQMRLEAAALAFAKKMAPRIILLDGAINPQADEQISKKYIQKNSGTHSGRNYLMR